MRTLGIDFGHKRIGLALSDATGEFALPYGVVENGPEAIIHIGRVCVEHGVGDIVVGDSKDFNGEDNAIMQEIRIFIESLKAASQLQVHTHPEFMTSAQAERLQGKNNMLDASAAAIILSSYLDMKKNSKID